MFEPDFSGKLSDSIHQIFSLSMNNFGNIVQITFCLLILPPDLVNLLILLLKFILFTAEILSEIHLNILFCLELLLKQ